MIRKALKIVCFSLCFGGLGWGTAWLLDRREQQRPRPLMPPSEVILQMYLQPLALPSIEAVSAAAEKKKALVDTALISKSNGQH